MSFDFEIGEVLLPEEIVIFPEDVGKVKTGAAKVELFPDIYVHLYKRCKSVHNVSSIE
ncbi:hypothetical protein DPMN_099555 [Dreissena polymorpha]|uniref:Uncharacterized protein n=1 Tax=Dreissena polymorpha TaxID=45954 RepID=A0A9D4LFQ4_DREPO|nr:hypothetical protein DPMN_099555 [Dreissena polymorpha]